MGDILKFIIDRLDKGSFSEHDLVIDGHQQVPHVALDLGYKLYAVHEQELKQLLADITFVTTKLTLDVFDERLRIKGFAVIHVRRSEHKVQNLAPVIDNQMQLESEEPSHRAFPALGYPLERLKDEYPLLLADP